MSRITDEQRDLAISMARNGQGRNAIARVVGISVGSVTNIIRDAGLSFDRAATEQATKARKVEMAERRAALELDYLEDAQRLRRLLWTETEYRDLGSFADADGGRKYSQYVSYLAPHPIPADQLKLMQASTTAVTASQKIADAASDQGTEAAKSMLAGLQEMLGNAWRELQAADQ